MEGRSLATCSCGRAENHDPNSDQADDCHIVNGQVDMSTGGVANVFAVQQGHPVYGSRLTRR